MDKANIHSSQKKKTCLGWWYKCRSTCTPSVSHHQCILAVKWIHSKRSVNVQIGDKIWRLSSQINFDNYERWLKTKLIPNLLPSSVIAVDNAACHNVQLTPAPNSCQTCAVIDWLSDCDIPVSDKMCMPELNSLIKLRKPRLKTFKFILYWLHMATLSFPFCHITQILIWFNWYWDQLKSMLAKWMFPSRWCYGTGLGKVQYHHKGRTQLEVQQCPLMQTELLVAGTYYWLHFRKYNYS